MSSSIVTKEWQDAGKTCGYTAIHKVHEPPDDLAAVTSRTFILEHPSDLDSRLAPNDVLALVDVELINPSIAMDRITLRQVFWLRHAVSYSTVLHFLLAYGMCERDPEIRCTLHHNRQVWDRRDDAFYVIANADYIKLQIVGSEGTGWVDLQSTLRHVESTLQRRSIYGKDSPSAGGVSMSDSDQDPQLPNEPDGEPDVCNMLQVAARCLQEKKAPFRGHMAVHPRAFTTGSGKIPVPWTHVTDRWCPLRVLTLIQSGPLMHEPNCLHDPIREGPQARKFPVSLAAHVEQGSCTELLQRFDLPLKIVDVVTAWTNAPLSAMHDLPSTVELQEPTRSMLNGQSNDITAPVLHIFTDGSAADTTMSWRFVIVNCTFFPSHRNPVAFILIDGEVHDRYFCR